MKQLDSHSWNWETTAEALLELHRAEFSVFTAKPFSEVVGLVFRGHPGVPGRPAQVVESRNP